MLMPIKPQAVFIMAVSLSDKSSNQGLNFPIFDELTVQTIKKPTTRRTPKTFERNSTMYDYASYPSGGPNDMRFVQFGLRFHYKFAVAAGATSGNGVPP